MLPVAPGHMVTATDVNDALLDSNDAADDQQNLRIP